MASILKEFEVFNFLPDDIKIQVKCFYVTSNSKHTYCVTNDDQVYGVGKGIHGILNYEEFHQEYYTKIEELCDKNVAEFVEDRNHGMFARTTTGEIYGWGRNNHQLFQNNLDYSRPKLVEFFKNKSIAQIGFGINYFLTLSNDNIIYGQGVILEQKPRLKEVYDDPDIESKFIKDQVTIEIDELLSTEIGSKLKEQVQIIYCFVEMAFVIDVDGLVYCSSSEGWMRIPRLNNVCKIQMTRNMVVFLSKDGKIELWDVHDRKWLDDYYVDSTVSDICAIRQGVFGYQLLFEDEQGVLRHDSSHSYYNDNFIATGYKSIFEYNLFKNQFTQKTINVKDNRIEYLNARQLARTVTVEGFHGNCLKNQNLPKKLKNFRVLNPFPKNVENGLKCFYQSGEYSSNNYIAFYVTNDNRVYSFGDNSSGKLGLGHNNKVDEFVEITVLKDEAIEEFFDGGYSMFARNKNNKLFTWGANSCETVMERPEPGSFEYHEPKPFDLGDDNIEIIQIEHCLGYYLALSVNGQVYGWGNNEHGQISSEEQDIITKPIFIKIKHDDVVKKIKYIHCFNQDSFALSVEGEVFVWGNNICEQGILKVYAQKCSWLFLKTDGSIVIFDTIKNEYRSIKTPTRFTDIFIHMISPESQWNPTVLQSEQCVYELNEQGVLIKTNYHNFYDYFLQVFKTTIGTIHVNHHGYILVKNIVCGSNSGKLLTIQYKNVYQDKYVKEFYKPGNLPFYCYQGKGSFGEVHQLCSQKQHGQRFAIKQIDLLDSLSCLDDTNQLFEKIQIMCKVKSEFVVHYIDSWIETKFIDGEFKKYAYIQMELMSQSLKNVIQSIRSISNPKFERYLYLISCEIFLELIESLGYLHSNQIIHRHLKPENVLISDGINGRFLKLCDYGLGKILDNTVFTGYSKVSSDCFEQIMDQGDLANVRGEADHRYIAPEVLNSTNYNTKADIYSLALMSGEIFNFQSSPYLLRPRRHKPNNLKYYSGEFLKIFKQDDIKLKFIKLLDTLERCLYSEHSNDRPDCEELLKGSKQWTISKDEIPNDENETNFIKFIMKENEKCLKLIYEQKTARKFEFSLEKLS